MILNKSAMENIAARPDIRAKVTGSARYAMDQYPKGVIYAQSLRFPYGKGKVQSADVEAAKKIKGVLEVAVWMNEEGKYAGQKIGEVVAESPAALGDAIRALKLKFRSEDARTRPEDLYAGVPDGGGDDKASADEVSSLLSSADHVVEATYTTQVQTHISLEPHGSTVHYKGEEAEAWVSTQSLMSCHEGFTKALELPGSKVLVHAEFVGGGFGSKFGIGPEGAMAAKYAKRFKRPCRVFNSRREEHADGGNRPGSIQYMKIAASSDGKLLGGRIHVVSTVGHADGRGGVRNPGYYNFGKVFRTETTISLNASLPAAFRAPGFPQASFAFESLMDELAAKVGMDPVEFRKKNETSDRRRKQLDIGADLIGWKDRKPDGAGKGIIKTGYGVAAGSWGNGKGKCEADVDIYRDGTVECRIGIQDIGTGANVLAVDLVADHLQIPRTLIVGKLGNSSFPPGPGSGGSVTSRVAAPAVRDAAQKALDLLTKRVAEEWKISADKVVYTDGNFSEIGTSRKVAWKGACSLISIDRISARGSFNDAYWGTGESDTVQFAKVEVDSETGIVRVKKVVAVQACGKPINRLTVENQICGGVIQGLSYALFEDRRLDGPTGGHVNPDMLFYKVAGTKDIPEIVPFIDWEEGEEGVRSLGEPVTVPTSGAIANAVANALGVRVRDLPITPARVLTALASQKGASA